MREIKVALLGFGNAGKAFEEVLISKQEELQTKYDCQIKLVAKVTKSKGNLLEPKGIDAMEVARTVDYDILIEATPLDILTGQPAIDHIRIALEREKDVITANKGPIAWAYRELKELAEKNHCQFCYETTVMDGTPVFNLVQDTLKLCEVTEVQGILNTTTNFVLGELERGKTYEMAIEAGQKRGFVEADPTLDLDGFDAAAKLTALVNVLMKGDLTPDKVDRTGISEITKESLKEAGQRGKTIKLLCKAYWENEQIKAIVSPKEVDKVELFANIDATSSVVSITTDLMGKISIVEHNPEIEQTAYGIFSDLIRVIEKGQY